MDAVKELEAVAARASADLSDIRDIERAPYSALAFGALQGRIADFIADLIGESTRESRRNGSEAISAREVNEAARRLTLGPRRRMFMALTTIGGIVFGAGLSELINLIGSASYTTPVVLLTVGLLVAGAIFLSLGFAKG